MNGVFKEQLPTSKSERIVVDEIFGNGTVRLLRAKRLSGASKDDLGIETWGEEEEDFQRVWQVSAFVGYPSNKKVQEGDVFFVVDGDKLNKDYKPIKRVQARKEHLLQSWDYSKEFARKEIKTEFYKLSVDKLYKKEEDRTSLYDSIDKKVQAMDSFNDEGGE